MPSVPTLHVVVTLPTIAGDPLDWSSNSFTYQVDSVDSTSIADAMQTAEDFYTHAIGGSTIGSLLSGALDRGTDKAVARCYDISAHLDGTPHGSPVGLDTFTIPAQSGGAIALPEGCAVVPTFHSDYGTDVEFGVGTRPRARDRGRVYIGPLTTDWITTDPTTGRCSVKSAYRGIVAGACDYMRTTPHGTCVWAVWSRKNATANAVVGGWVDDRFDYQRRREDQGLIRTNWP